jgi:hypothetical protein
LGQVGPIRPARLRTHAIAEAVDVLGADNRAGI